MIKADRCLETIYSMSKVKVWNGAQMESGMLSDLMVRLTVSLKEKNPKSGREW
jgi:hypothetical protein